MVLYEKGSEKYFADDLLTFLREKKNDDVRRIMEKYQPSDASLTISRLKDSSNSTLLHYAAEYGNEEITKLLIDLGSEIDAQDKLGRSPLILALIGKHLLVIQVLMKANPNLRLTNVDGKCAFQMILDLGKDFAGILEENFRRKGFSLIQVACFKSAQLIKWFLNRGHAVNEKDKESGITALHVAVMLRNLEMIKLLIDHGADVDALDDTKFTPFMCLCIDPDNCDYSDEFIEIVSVLLSHMTLLTASNKKGCMQISNLLVFGYYKIVDEILKRVDNLFVSDERGNTVLHYIVLNKDEQVIELLRDREFNVNARNRNGLQPLHLATAAHNPHNVKFLLEHGAGVVNPDVEGNGSPLGGIFYTLKFDSRLDNSKKCIELLLEYGADPFEDDLGMIFDLVSQRYTEAAQQADQAKEPKKILAVMEPIITIFAIKKSLRPQMIELVNSEIQQQPSWVKYFEMCKGLVDQVSKTTISGSVTLLRFLTESQEKITAYARNDELVCELKKLIEESGSNSPYLNLLRHRFTKAVEAAELKKKAVAAICWLINLKNNAHYFTAEYIVSYLSNDDMKNLDSVKQLCRDNEGT